MINNHLKLTNYECISKKKRICSVSKYRFFTNNEYYFDDFLSRDLMEMTGPNFATLGTNLPSVNLKETDEKIEVNHNTLIISSEKEEEKEEIRNNENYYRKEFSYQSFSKSFNLLDYNMKITSVSITKTAYCMLILPKKKAARKKTAKTIAIK